MTVYWSLEEHGEAQATPQLLESYRKSTNRCIQHVQGPCPRGISTSNAKHKVTTCYHVPKLSHRDLDVSCPVCQREPLPIHAGSLDVQ